MLSCHALPFFELRSKYSARGFQTFVRLFFSLFKANSPANRELLVLTILNVLRDLYIQRCRTKPESQISKFRRFKL